MKIVSEHINHPDRSVRLHCGEASAFRGPRHVHHQVELTWIEHGTGVRLVGDHSGPFEAGDLVLLGPQVPHIWLTVGEEQTPRPKVWVVQFLPELVTKAQMPELARAAPLLALASRALKIEGDTAAHIKPLMSGMADADDYARLASLLLIVGYLLAGTADIRPIITGQADASLSELKTRRIDRVVEWMRRELAGKLRVDAAAAIANVSPASFGRWFLRETGKGFMDYVGDLRFAAACVALGGSNQPLAAISAECGYATLSNFHRQFRRRAGVTPIAYRSARLRVETPAQWPVNTKGLPTSGQRRRGED